MNILIVEDELVAAQRITNMLKTQVPDAVITGICDSVEETVKLLKEQPTPDLMLMDIELSDGKSFDIFEEVKITCPVIFTTAYNEYVMKAFSVHSIDYLLKPIQPESLKRSIDKFRELRLVYKGGTVTNTESLIAEIKQALLHSTVTQRDYFLVKHGHRLLSISTAEVAYFYSENGITFLRTTAGNNYSLDETLDDLDTQIDPKTFHRCSRKFIVSRNAIINAFVHFNGKLKVAVKPTPPDDVIISRERAAAFKKWMGG